MMSKMAKAKFEDFQEAANFLSRMMSTSAAASRVPNDVKLRLYALYKQATEGDNDKSPPIRPVLAMLPNVPYMKWEAWKKCKGMSQSEAKKLYIDIVNELF